MTNTFGNIFLKQRLIFLNVFGLTLTEAETDLEEDQKKTKHFENHFSKLIDEQLFNSPLNY